MGTETPTTQFIAWVETRIIVTGEAYDLGRLQNAKFYLDPLFVGARKATIERKNEDNVSGFDHILIAIETPNGAPVKEIQNLMRSFYMLHMIYTAWFGDEIKETFTSTAVVSPELLVEEGATIWRVELAALFEDGHWDRISVDVDDETDITDDWYNYGDAPEDHVFEIAAGDKANETRYVEDVRPIGFHLRGYIKIGGPE